MSGGADCKQFGLRVAAHADMRRRDTDRDVEMLIPIGALA